MQLDTLTPFPPVLDLGGFALRPLRPDDAAAWYTYLSDPEVTRLTSYDIRSVDSVEQMLASYIAGYAQRTSSRWALARKGSDALVGTCGFVGWEVNHSAAEIGYDSSRECWGKGLMTRAVDTVVRWGFEQARINRIQATVMVGNAASARVLEKCGFRREGTLREFKICRGEPRDFWMFALLRGEWASTRAPTNRQ